MAQLKQKDCGTLPWQYGLIWGMNPSLLEGGSGPEHILRAPTSSPAQQAAAAPAA